LTESSPGSTSKVTNKERQDLLVNARPGQVRDEVHRLQRELGAGAGYILEPGITLQADVPLENILALIDAARS